MLSLAPLTAVATFATKFTLCATPTTMLRGRLFERRPGFDGGFRVAVRRNGALRYWPLRRHR
jgi:hypothetical protein